jgi:hypothetical protein
MKVSGSSKEAIAKASEHFAPCGPVVKQLIRDAVNQAESNAMNGGHGDDVYEEKGVWLVRVKLSTGGNFHWQVDTFARVTS